MISAREAGILTEEGHTRKIERQIEDVSNCIRDVAKRGKRCLVMHKLEAEVLRTLREQGFKVSHCTTGLYDVGIKIEW